MIANTKNSIALDRRALNGVGIPRTGAASAILRETLTYDDIRIRPCKESDYEAIGRLCCDTGFLGHPVDSLFRDRDLFADLFTRPYLTYEPEWGIVAESKGRVVGYLLGSVNRYFDWLQMWSGFQTAAKMVLRLGTGHYAGHPRSRKFIRWLFTAGLWEQPRHPGNAAHLHFDIEKEYRGRGLCQKMWTIYENRLRENGIAECYGAFFSHPKRRPEIVYKRYGFTVYDRCRTTLFQPEIPEPVEVVCVCKKL